MTGLTWLHLSDWHQGRPDFDRDVVVRDALIKDIRGRAERIDRSLAQVDFVVFSGDLAFSGKPAEYEDAQQHLLDPVLDAVGLSPDRLFIVPGNHDLSREHVYEMLPPELQKPLDTDALVQKWLNDQRRTRTLEPFGAYRTFVARYTGQSSPDYASVVRFNVGDKQVALLGLNSAWMSARHKDETGDVDDARHLVVGEPQIHDALAQIADADVRIAMLHHPFDWLAEFDRNHIEARLARECHFILRGHEHNPQVHVMRGTSGDCATIPAGACYKRRMAEDPRYTNAYNWVHLDFAAGEGMVYLRRWSNPRNEWIEDIDAHPGGEFMLKPLPKDIGAKPPSASPPPAAPPSPAPSLRYEREREVLEGYLKALVRNNADLEPGGIKQTKVRVVLPLDEIYIGLQADRDRPDVDRRVMQEELDEIKKRLEREEDPKEREKQYQIWANQARTLEQALEVSGPREELSSIVQRHRQVVILGDPGSGKTTLVRYLTLRFARAILAEPERLFQSQDLWDEKTVWGLPDLGPVRLPILLRISHYAEARQKDPDLSLVDYLPRYFAGLSVPHADDVGSLLRRLLEAGRCIVLLDGLDEIIHPADRRNIATAIGQFAGVYRETGLPDWLARSLAFAPARIEERPEAQAETEEEEIAITWDKNMPEDVRQGWERRIKQRRKEGRRGAKAMRLAWELLDEARYAHVGNRFVVTSRIAGYHFSGVPGEFEHYTIRRMSLDDIKLFLAKWCPAVERRIAEAPDPAQVEQRARREIDGILQAVETTPGVRRMAENPLLLRILAIIHRNEAHLPQRRVELYETATVTLLRDWNLERGAKAAVIDDVKAMSLLGPVAFHIHENRASGFLSKGETERILAGILARERGEKDPEQPSLETREAVRLFLETVREHSGLFVERGEGLYAFMHLTFEEYFTARHLVSSSARARSQILERLHLPRWREPILLAVGSLSKQFYDDTHDLLRAILEAGSPYEPVLHRDLLFAAACVGDSVNVALVLRREIASRLLDIYCNRRHAGRYRLLQRQVRDALMTLCNDQGDTAVEAALAETLMDCADRPALTCALEAVDWLKARTPAVARALAARSEPSVLPRAQELLRAVQARVPVNGNGTRPAPAGWDAVRDDPALACLLGAMWRYGWRDTVEQGLRVADPALLEIAAEAAGPGLRGTLGRLYDIARRLEDPAISRESMAELNEELRRQAFEIRRQADESGEPLVRELGYELEHLAFGYRSGIPPEELTYRIRRLLAHPGFDRRYAAPELAPALSAEIQARFELLERRLRSMEDTPETGALARREVARFAQELESHARQSDAPGLRAAARELERMSDDLGRMPGPVDVRSLALRVREALEGGAGREALPEQLLRWGSLILRNALRGGTLASLFAARAARLIPLQPLPDDDALRASCQAIQIDLSDALLETLRRAADAPRYSDAALFLAYTGEGRTRDDAVAIALGDLESTNVARRRLALQVLAESAFRKHVQFTDARRALLLSLLDAPADQATPALDILFAMGLTPNLLAWCWAVLRRPDHPLADAVREKLDGSMEIKGERPLLALLDEGRRDATLRTVSLELLRKVSWQGTETFAQVLVWLADEDADARHLAALLLAGSDSPFDNTPRDVRDIPRNVLAKTAQERLSATGASWAALRKDAPLVRLLGGLWLNGWDEALTQLWVSQPAAAYVDKHPTKWWRSFRTYPESEECIRWLLEKAEFGQTLIPAFRRAAARLAELEGDVVQSAPQAEHIAAVQHEIGQQMDALLARPDTPPVLAAEAAILAAATRGQAIPPVSAATLQAELEGADDRDWAAALARLAGQPDQQSAVVAALNQAFASADRERRLLALALLSNREELRVALAETLTARYLGQAVEADEALPAVGLLLHLKPSPAGLYPWVCSLVTTERDLPLAVWLRQTLAAHGLTPDAQPAVLAGLLTAENADVRLAASLALLAADLPVLLVPVMVEAALSPDDRVRFKGNNQFKAFCHNQLPTDGSTQVIEWLQRTCQSPEGKGHGGTVLATAISGSDYQSTYWPAKWIQAIREGNDEERRSAREALKTIGRPSPAVIQFICDHLSNEQPTRVRKAAVCALLEIRRYNHELRSDTVIHAALTAALDDPDTDVRRSAAYALQWTEAHGAWAVTQALLRAAQADLDGETRALALRSAGRVLHRVRGFRDVDVSKEALFRWLQQKCPNWMNDFVNPIGQLPSLKDAPDANVALEILAHPDTLGLPEETTSRLRSIDAWGKLVQGARQEWQARSYCVETLPHLPAALAQVESLLASPEPAIRRAAACALARLYHGDDDRPARLRDLLPNDAALLEALLGAATDRDNWADEAGLKPASHHPWAVKQIAGWVEARPPEERARLIAGMLDDLESAMVGMEAEESASDVIGDEQWCLRRALVAVLAELSERLTYRAFTSQRDLADVVALFSRAAADPNSYSTRRFAIRALGNLQQLTPQVADVFFAACQDVGDVYRETRTAVSRFKSFGPGSLERLTASIRSPSITVAYHAALLLGELGVSRSEDLGREGRKRVADELVQLLGDPLSERIVYDFNKSSDGERVGPLYDVIYEALMRVVAGPDAPASHAMTSKGDERT